MSFPTVEFTMFRSMCLVALTVLLSPGMADRAIAQEEAPKGKILARSYDFKEAGKRMEYSLYVPTSYEKEKASPLIVALHGLGSSDREIIRYPRFTRNAEKHGYIIVAPMGYTTTGWYGVQGQRSRSWRPKPSIAWCRQRPKSSSRAGSGPISWNRKRRSARRAAISGRVRWRRSSKSGPSPTGRHRFSKHDGFWRLR